jgi:hypothetical protein
VCELLLKLGEGSNLPLYAAIVGGSGLAHLSLVMYELKLEDVNDYFNAFVRVYRQGFVGG